MHSICMRNRKGNSVIIKILLQFSRILINLDKAKSLLLFNPIIWKENQNERLSRKGIRKFC